MIVPTLWHEDDPYDSATLQQEIRRWSRNNTMGLLLSQLGFNVHSNSSKADRLAQQVARWSWEVQSVQACRSQSGLTYHPVRTAWLWMEEYGPEIWPEQIDKRKHLDPLTDFTYLRDRSTPSEVPGEHFLDIDKNIAEFCFSKGTLHPYNSMFQTVLRYFASVHAGLWHDVDYIVCEDWTAAELMAEFLGLEPWIPLKGLLPLYYGSMFSEYNGSCESCDGDCSACTGLRVSINSKKHPAILELNPGYMHPNRIPGSPMDGMEG